MNRTTIAAIFAHPDDEVLACGGALAGHAAAGDRVRILILATGLTARGTTDPAAIEALRGQACRAAKTLGAEPPVFADFPDNAMDGVPLLHVVQRIEAFLAEDRPSTVYTHHGGDLNIDHRIVSQAVVTACRPLPGAGPLDILTCEVNSSTEWSTEPLAPFVPNDFLDIGATLQAKLDALACYGDEMRPWPHPRSLAGVEALARWRGAQAGFEAAEAFHILRRVRAAL